MSMDASIAGLVFREIEAGQRLGGLGAGSISHEPLTQNVPAALPSWLVMSPVHSATPEPEVRHS